MLNNCYTHDEMHVTFKRCFFFEHCTVPIYGGPITIKTKQKYSAQDKLEIPISNCNCVMKSMLAEQN